MAASSVMWRILRLSFDFDIHQYLTAWFLGRLTD